MSFYTYNPGTDLFVLFRGLVEFHPAGAVVPSFQVIAADLAHTYRAWRDDGASAVPLPPPASCLDFGCLPPLPCR